MGLDDLSFSLIVHSLNQASALPDPFFSVFFFFFPFFLYVFFEVQEGHSVLMRANEDSLCDSQPYVI